MLQILHRLIFAAALLALVVGNGNAVADSPTQPSATDIKLREYMIKAAFLYNFARFTDWPAGTFENADDPLRLCVIGADPFGPALDSLNGQNVRDRRLSVARLAAPDEARRCEILFISASEEPHLAEILAAVDGSPTLTVADLAGFAENGGIIRLTTVANKIRFEINLDAARAVDLRFSSRLLRIAKVRSESTKAVLEN